MVDRRMGPFPDERVFPPFLRRDSDLVQALTRIMQRLQQPISSGRSEARPPLDIAGSMGQSALDRANRPIDDRGQPGLGGGPEQPYPPGFEQRPPPSLSRPTPGQGQSGGPSLGQRALSGLDSALPGASSLAGGLGAAGSALGGAYNFSPSTAGAAGGAATGGGEQPYPPGFEQRPPSLGGAQPPSLAGPTPGLPTAGGGASTGLANPRVDDLATGYAPRGSTTGGGAAGADPLAALSGFGRFNEGVNEKMLADPTNAVRGAFQALGIDPAHNIYAQQTIDRYGPALASLAEVYAWVTTGSPEGADEAGMMPQFLRHFMSGGDVRGILKQAFDMAATNPGLKQGLTEMGAQQIAQMAAATSGQGQAGQRARARLFTDRVNQRAIQQMQNPNDADESAFLEDIRRSYGI